MTALAHTRWMFGRDLLRLWRQPVWIFVTVTQPVVWLLLFGALFQRVAFTGTGDYHQFLAPGIVIMTAMFSAGWSGMSTIEDLERGVVDRFLVTPAHPASFLVGRVLREIVSMTVQALIIVGLSLLVGATFPGGVPGIAGLILVAALLSAAFGAMSNALALILRRRESLIASVNFLLLPLTFLSPALVPRGDIPDWIRTASDISPFGWAVSAGRALALDGSTAGMAWRVGALAAFAGVMLWLATRAVRAYQRSI